MKTVVSSLYYKHNQPFYSRDMTGLHYIAVISCATNRNILMQLSFRSLVMKGTKCQHIRSVGAKLVTPLWIVFIYSSNHFLAMFKCKFMSMQMTWRYVYNLFNLCKTLLISVIIIIW